MFKDFGRRLQRDIKRRADARMEANRRITMQASVPVCAPCCANERSVRFVSLARCEQGVECLDA